MKVLVRFIDEHRAEFGVEPICEQLQMAPSSYQAAKRRETAPSARARRDAEMGPVLEALWTKNQKVGTRSPECSLEGADLRRVGHVQIGRTVSRDGYWRTELSGGNRSTEHAGAFGWGLGQCDSGRVPCLGERPEQFRDQRPVAVDERSVSDRCQGLARGAHREARAARQLPDADRLARVDQERRGHRDTGATANRITCRAGLRRPGVRRAVEVEVEVKRIVSQIEAAAPIEEPDASVAELGLRGVGELVSDHDEQPGARRLFDVAAGLHRVDPARCLHNQFEGFASWRADLEVGGAVCGERWDASGGERRGDRFDR